MNSWWSSVHSRKWKKKKQAKTSTFKITFAKFLFLRSMALACMIMLLLYYFRSLWFAMVAVIFVILLLLLPYTLKLAVGLCLSLISTLTCYDKSSFLFRVFTALRVSFHLFSVSLHLFLEKKKKYAYCYQPSKHVKQIQNIKSNELWDVRFLKTLDFLLVARSLLLFLCVFF